MPVSEAAPENVGLSESIEDYGIEVVRLSEVIGEAAPKIRRLAIPAFPSISSLSSPTRPESPAPVRVGDSDGSTFSDGSDGPLSSEKEG